MRRQPPWLFLAFILIIPLFPAFLSCQGSGKKNYAGPPGYDVSKAVRYNLPAELDEISGIFFYQKDSSLLAINDEIGRLYKIFLQVPLKIERWRFSDNGDYEDIALADSTFYVIKSKGKLEKFSFSGGSPSAVEEIELPQPGEKEFESLFYDEHNRRLVAICKECKSEDKGKMPVWFLDIGTGSFSSKDIDAAPILAQLNDRTQKRFKPSAAALHPLTGEWFVISSVNKGLAVLDRNGRFDNVYPLDPKLFKQPEGLTFTSNGDLIVSNEMGDEGTANILFFKYQNQKRPR
jgi:hypothetical protein